MFSPRYDPQIDEALPHRQLHPARGGLMFTDALTATAAALTAAGLNASVDPAEVSPPGVVVRAASVVPGVGETVPRTTRSP